MGETAESREPEVGEPAAGERAGEAVAAARRTTAVELLWDLVFVFAVTQVTTLLAARPSWAGFGRSMLVLALVWWAWSAFVWAANAEPEGSAALRAVLLAATVLIFIAGLALPHAFGSEGWLFALAYVLVRGLHLVLYVHAARRGNAAASAIAGFAVTVAVGMGLLLGGALVTSGTGRAVAWTAAAAIDYAGPGWLTRDRLRGLQEVAVAHFAERYGSFVIICLGESVVAVGVGVGALHRSLDAGLVMSAMLGLAVALGMWWTYFHSFAERARRRLSEHDEPVLLAADAYSYLHLVIVAGIIVFAGAIKLEVHRSWAAPIAAPARLALCGGVALYLLGLSGFRLRVAGEAGHIRLAVAAALLVLYGLTATSPAWLVAAGVAVLVALVCAAESAADDTRHT